MSVVRITVSVGDVSADVDIEVTESDPKLAALIALQKSLFPMATELEVPAHKVLKLMMAQIGALSRDMSEKFR